MIPVWIIGYGGHAKVAIDALRASQHYRLAGTISDDPSAPPLEPELHHIGPVTPEVLRQHDVRHAFIAIGSNDVRSSIADRIAGSVEWVSIVHPSAIVSPTATVGAGVLLAAGAIIQPPTTIGDHAIINTAASVDHDCIIGAFAHIAPGTHLSGGVSVGTGTLLGVGTSVIPGITIGAHALVGAGSVVIHDIPDGAKVAGNPAKPIRSSAVPG